MTGKESEARQAETPSENDKNKNHNPSAIRYPRRLLIRMTTEERRTLGRKAHAAELSISRFVIQSAMRGKAPPSQAERAELESLMFLVKRAANVLTRLLANARAMRLIGADKEIEEQLKGASDILLRLLAELRRRL